MLREETVEPGTLGLLRKLVSLPEMRQYRLVGGTALSLLYGHRKSIDLDFFTDEPHDLAVLLPALENNFGRVIPINERFKNIYQCEIQNVKDPFLNPVQIIAEIPFADTKDLIALKLNAVKGRGVKKDFWDVAKLLEFYTLKELFQFYHERYPYDDTQALNRSIIYFADAEDAPQPESFDGMTWAKVKSTITNAFDDYFSKKRN
jgi:predicted nucleotidyltransferase component of viral defense system